MRLRPAVQRSIAAALAAVAVPAACSHPHPAGPVAAPASAGSRTPVFSPSPPPISAAPRPPAPGTITLGHSALGRPITATETGDASAGRRLVVVGCIHGNEPAGIAIAERLIEIAPPVPGLALWVVPVLNPDGVAADTRQRRRPQPQLPPGLDVARSAGIAAVRRAVGALGAGVPARPRPPAPAPAHRHDLVPPAARPRGPLRRRLRRRATLRRRGGASDPPARPLSRKRTDLGEPRAAREHGLRGRAPSRPAERRRRRAACRSRAGPHPAGVSAPHPPRGASTWVQRKSPACSLAHSRNVRAGAPVISSTAAGHAGSGSATMLAQ